MDHDDVREVAGTGSPEPVEKKFCGHCGRPMVRRLALFGPSEWYCWACGGGAYEQGA